MVKRSLGTPESGEEYVLTNDTLYLRRHFESTVPVNMQNDNNKTVISSNGALNKHCINGVKSTMTLSSIRTKRLLLFISLIMFICFFTSFIKIFSR